VAKIKARAKKPRYQRHIQKGVHEVRIIGGPDGVAISAPLSMPPEHVALGAARLVAFLMERLPEDALARVHERLAMRSRTTKRGGWRT